MRFSILLSSFLTLAACQTTVNTPGQATPELEQLIQPVLDRANAASGQRRGTDMIERGATSEGNTIIFLNEASQSLSDTFRELPRGQVDGYLSTRLRQELCLDAEPRAFILAGGRVQMRIVDNLGREVSKFTVSSC